MSKKIIPMLTLLLLALSTTVYAGNVAVSVKASSFGVGVDGRVGISDTLVCVAG